MKWEKLKSLFGINLLKYSSEFLAHLGHRGTPTSLVFVLTLQTFFTPGIKEKQFVPRKVLQPKNLFAGF